MELDVIVAATDFSGLSRRAVEEARHLAGETGARLYLLHVLDLPPALDPLERVQRSDIQALRGAAMDRMKECLEGASGVERVVLEGHPAGAIARFAEERKADMVVVGTHGRTGLKRLLVGSTTEGLIRQSPCPVLVIRRPSPRERRSRMGAAERHSNGGKQETTGGVRCGS